MRSSRLVLLDLTCPFNDTTPSARNVTLTSYTRIAFRANLCMALSIMSTLHIRHTLALSGIAKQSIYTHEHGVA